MKQKEQAVMPDLWIEHSMGLPPRVPETRPVTSWVARLTRKTATRIELAGVFSPQYFEYCTSTN